MSGALLAQTADDLRGNGFPTPERLCPPGCGTVDACYQKCTPQMGGSFKVDKIDLLTCITSPNCYTGTCETHTYSGPGCEDLLNDGTQAGIHCGVAPSGDPK